MRRRLHAALQACASLVQRHCTLAVEGWAAGPASAALAGSLHTGWCSRPRAAGRPVQALRTQCPAAAAQAGTYVPPFAVVTLYAVAHCDEPTLACLTTGPVPRFCSIQLLTESAFRLRAAYSTLSALRYGLAVHGAR